MATLEPIQPRSSLPRYSWSSVTARRGYTISKDLDKFIDTYKSKNKNTHTSKASALPDPVEEAVQTNEIEASPSPLPEVGELLGLTSHRRGISDVTVRAEREEEDAVDRYGTQED